MRETIELKRPSLLIPRLHRYTKLNLNKNNAGDNALNLWGRLTPGDQKILCAFAALTVLSFLLFDPLDAVRRFGLALADVTEDFNWGLSRDPKTCALWIWTRENPKKAQVLAYNYTVEDILETNFNA